MDYTKDTFDWKFYIEQYQDLREAGILTKEKALWHWNKYGKNENRNNRKIITYEKKDRMTKNKIKIEDNTNTKISIVMTYYNRKKQTLETLKGFQSMYGVKYNFEVVIVDDNSNDEHRLEEDIKQFTFPINLIVINAEEKGERINPCIAYNRGFKEAKGEIIIIQNPECYHVGDILKHTLENLNEQDYYSYSCFTANCPEITQEMINSENVFELIKSQEFLDKNVTDTSTQMNWYNHPTDTAHGGRNTAYHFCNAIYKSKLDLIGGFDKRFADGYCFDDDQLLLAVKYNLKLDIKIIEPKKCFVIHQYHTRNDSSCCEKEDDNHIIKSKWLKNKELLEKIKKNHLKNDFVYPKLLFLYWDGSPLSYLNYLTVVSFNKYNPDWKIIVYMPYKKTDTISWKSHEQKLRYTGIDYMYKLNDIDNVIIKKICLNDIGFDNTASEVIKSDYFRYYILEKHGGLWSDFDIIYTGSIEEKMNFNENSIIFRCISYQYPKDKSGHNYNYYPIGFFISKPNSKFFKYIKQKCIENYDPDEYQSIGAVMFGKLFPVLTDVYKVDDNVKICDYQYYLPWAWNELYEFYDNEYLNNKLPDNNIGIHWFNGADKSKYFSMELNKRINNFSIECYLDTHLSHFVDPNDYKAISSRKNCYHQIKTKTPNFQKISIVMAYFNRKDQLEMTLESIKKSRYPNKEIIIVDDNSRPDQRVELFIDKYRIDLDIKVISIKENEKTWVNPCIPYNKGIKIASGDIIVLQNPEVMHLGDCLSFINDNLNEKDWLSFNCYGSPNFQFNEKLKNKTSNEIFNNIYNINFNIGGNSVAREDVGGWLNHYKKHFVAYHYLTAIHKSDIDNYLSSGFNENFKNGIGSDDDELIKRLIYSKFNFKINKFENGQPFCIHLFHEKPEQLKELDWRDNKKFFIESCINMNMIPENDIALAPKNEIPMSRQVIIE